MSLRLRVGTTMADAMERYRKRQAEMDTDLDMLLLKKGWTIQFDEDSRSDVYSMRDCRCITRQQAVDHQMVVERREMLEGAKR